MKRHILLSFLAVLVLLVFGVLLSSGQTSSEGEAAATKDETWSKTDFQAITANNLASLENVHLLTNEQIKQVKMEEIKKAAENADFVRKYFEGSSPRKITADKPFQPGSVQEATLLDSYLKNKFGGRVEFLTTELKSENKAYIPIFEKSMAEKKAPGISIEGETIVIYKDGNPTVRLNPAGINDLAVGGMEKGKVTARVDEYGILHIGHLMVERGEISVTKEGKIEAKLMSENSAQFFTNRNRVSVSGSVESGSALITLGSTYYEKGKQKWTEETVEFGGKGRLHEGPSTVKIVNGVLWVANLEDTPTTKIARKEGSLKVIVRGPDVLVRDGEQLTQVGSTRFAQASGILK